MSTAVSIDEARNRLNSLAITQLAEALVAACLSIEREYAIRDRAARLAERRKRHELLDRMQWPVLIGSARTEMVGTDLPYEEREAALTEAESEAEKLRQFVPIPEPEYRELASATWGDSTSVDPAEAIADRAYLIAASDYECSMARWEPLYHTTRVAVNRIIACRHYIIGKKWPGWDPSENLRGTATGGSTGSASGRTTLAVAEVLVADFIGKIRNAKPTRDVIAKSLGISTGLVSETKAWKVYKGTQTVKTRVVPLTGRIQAALPSEGAPPEELAALIEEQQREMKAENKTKASRRHGSPSRPS